MVSISPDDLQVGDVVQIIAGMNIPTVSSSVSFSRMESLLLAMELKLMNLHSLERVKK